MDHSLGRTVVRVFIVLLIQCNLPGAVGTTVQVVIPPEIESVNGSAVDMECTSPLVDSDGLMVCGGCSYLTDGVSPDIDTTTADWASQLVTVKKSGGNANITYPHVLLTFGFDTNVSLTGIEIDLFLCPDWNIGAPSMYVYLDPDYNLEFRLGQFVSPDDDNSPQPSCDSLSTVTFTGDSFLTEPYHTFHILVDLSQHGSIEWVHVGEVRFIGIPEPVSCSLSSSTMALSSMTPSESSTTVHTPDFTEFTSTTAPQQPSSPDPSSPTDANTSGENNTTVLIVIAAIIAAIVVALLVVLIIIIVMVRKRRSSQAKLEELQDVVREGVGAGGADVELKRMESKQDEYTADNPLYTMSTPANGHQADAPPLTGEDGGRALVADNPHYYTTPIEPSSPGIEVDDGLYTVVDNEKKSALKPTVSSSADNQMYASISESKSKSSSPAPKDGGPVYAMVDKAKQSKRKKKPPAGVSNGVFVDEDPSNSPAVPPKSPDLQAYLSTQEAVPHPLPLPTSSANQPSKVSTLPESLAVGMSSNPNYESADALSHASHDLDSDMYAVPDLHTAPSATTTTEDGDIYSEPIQPSDFTHRGAKQQLEKAGAEEDSGPRIYSSIYTVAATKEKVQRPLEISGSNIKELNELGTGQFGKVVLAQTIDLSLKDMRLSNDPNRNISIYVAVKKLRSNANRAEREAFEKEIKFMSRLNHPNVVRFLGVCYNDPAFIIMEYMEQGDLSLFLQNYYEIVEIPMDASQIATISVNNMALQIASGMKYLASQNFVHRDLASRNCLVNEHFTVKLADFGMSRNLYESHYYKIKGNAILPIRWMATECFYGMFSEKTDVWAFGITMWELFTLAKDKPYPHMSDNEVVEDAVNKGEHRYIHPKPPACPQPVYDVMLCCWIIDRKKRATFEALHEMLLKIVHV